MKPLLSLLLLWLAGSSLLGATYGQRMVAAVLVAEAGIDGTNGMIAVAEVIRTSADQRGIPMLAEVQRRARYTSVLQAGSVDNLWMKSSRTRYYKAALEIARLAYNTPEKLPGITKGATYFHTTNTLPYWAKGMKPVVTIGSHHFYDPTRNQRTHR